jgi:hypothetical protein
MLFISRSCTPLPIGYSYPKGFEIVGMYPGCTPGCTSTQAIKMPMLAKHERSSQAFLDGEAPEITEADRMAHHAHAWPRANA